jgi:hypothetical protein
MASRVKRAVTSAVADHEELNGDERDKENKAYDVVTAYDELSEGGNDVTRGSRSFIAVQQNAARTGQVERQAKKSEQEQQAGENGKLYGTKKVDRREQHDDRCRDTHGQQKVEQKARHWDQHDEDHGNGGGWNDPVEICFFEERRGLRCFGHQEFPRAMC